MKNIPIRNIKTSQDSLFHAEKFKIQKIDDLCLKEDLTQKIHRHDFFFILALEKGSGKHEIDFNFYTVKDYSIFILRPGQVHSLNIYRGASGFLVEFNLDFYSPVEEPLNMLLIRATQTNYCQLTKEEFSKIFSVLDDIFQEYSEKKEKYIEVIRSYLNIFFIQFVRQGQTKTKESMDELSYSQKRLEEFLLLIEKNISIKKSVAEYAELLHLSSYQLNKIAKETLGKTCSQIINEQIILEAKRYLLATTQQINQIAFYLGYEDSSYFIRFFKKQTGISPEAFRQNFK